MQNAKLLIVTVIIAFAGQIATASAANPFRQINSKLNNILGILTSTDSIEPVTARVSRFVDNEPRVVLDAFVVPTGKVLVVEHVSIYLDVVVDGRPERELLIRGDVRGPNPADGAPTSLPLGYMDEYPFTSRGAPNFLISSPVRAYFAAGTVQCVADPQFGGVFLTFGRGDCTITGRLIDAN